MAILKRRIEELERLQLKRHLELKAKRDRYDPRTGILRSGRNGCVLVVLPHPEPEPENRTTVEPPSDGKDPIPVLPKPQRPTAVKPKQPVTYGGLDQPEEWDG